MEGDNYEEIFCLCKFSGTTCVTEYFELVLINLSMLKDELLNVVGELLKKYGANKGECIAILASLRVRDLGIGRVASCCAKIMVDM